VHPAYHVLDLAPPDGEQLVGIVDNLGHSRPPLWASLQVVLIIIILTIIIIRILLTVLVSHLYLENQSQLVP
jgi:hypothetical protein